MRWNPPVQRSKPFIRSRRNSKNEKRKWQKMRLSAERRALFWTRWWRRPRSLLAQRLWAVLSKLLNRYLEKIKPLRHRPKTVKTRKWRKLNRKKFSLRCLIKRSTRDSLNFSPLSFPDLHCKSAKCASSQVLTNCLNTIRKLPSTLNKSTQKSVRKTKFWSRLTPPTSTAS
jgi:hypothetical protein